jgi:opacity protein-like surface antigen
MRGMFVIAASAALLSLAAPAARANEMSFGLKGGVSIPTGDYGDTFGLGFMGGVYGDYGVTPQFAVGVDINGNFHSIKSDLKDQLEAGGITDLKANFTLIQFGVHGKWQQAVNTGPSAMVGVALYNGHSKSEGTDTSVVPNESFSETESDTKFGFNVGAGYKFWHNESMSLGLDASFHNVTDAFKDENGDSKSAQYISVGLDLGFLTGGATK